MLLGGERVLGLEVDKFSWRFVYDKRTGHYKTKFEQFLMIFLNFNNFPKHFSPFTNSNIVPNWKLNNYAHRAGFIGHWHIHPFWNISFTSLEL